LHNQLCDFLCIHTQQGQFSVWIQRLNLYTELRNVKKDCQLADSKISDIFTGLMFLPNMA